MKTIRLGRKKIEVESLEDFYAKYFFFLRSGIDAVGYDDDKAELFRIENGREQNEMRKRLFEAAAVWKAPSVAEVRGALAQFENLSKLARRMKIDRTTITLWKRTGGVNYYRWRYICEIMGVEVAPVVNEVPLATNM